MPENQNQKSSDEKSSEALMMGGAAAVALVFLVKFLVPIVIAIILAPLICLGLRGLPLKQKLKPFSLIALNLSGLTYLLVGLPFSLMSKKEQFTSIFGDYTTGVAAHM